MIYLRLFFEFFKIGLFSIGGGLATIPFLTDLGERTGWFTAGQLADMIAISESTPGPMGVNMATYVGFTSGGVGGGVMATLGLVCPCVIVILIIAKFLQKFRHGGKFFAIGFDLFFQFLIFKVTFGDGFEKFLIILIHRLHHPFVDGIGHKQHIITFAFEILKGRG